MFVFLSYFGYEKKISSYSQAWTGSFFFSIVLAADEGPVPDQLLWLLEFVFQTNWFLFGSLSLCLFLKRD